MERLKESIKLLQKQIKTHIHCINSGGCIHFAYYLSKKLTKLKIKHSIAFLHDNSFSISYNEFIPICHLMVYIPNVGYIDGVKTQKKFAKRYNHHKCTKVSLTKLDTFRHDFTWNDAYNTSQNDLLELLIDKTIQI